MSEDNNAKSNTSEFNLVSYYKFSSYRFIRTYRGTGYLNLPDGRLACYFECGQTVSADILCMCLLKDLTPKTMKLFHSLRFFNYQEEAPTFTGRSEGGQLVRLTVDIFLDRKLHWNASSINAMVIFSAKELSVIAPRRAKVVELKFYLTNFEFLHPPLRWHFNEHTIEIKYLEDYNEIVRALKASRGIDVTAEMSVKPSNQGIIADISYIEDLAYDICYLLSLARGCRVQWLYWDAISAKGKRIESHHHEHKITPYSGHYLIPKNPRTDIIEFLNQTFDNFRKREAIGKLGKVCKKKRKDVWKLDYAINHYVDALIENDYIELRALKLVVLVEFLTARYSWLHSTQHFMEPRTFDAKHKQKKLEDRTRDMLIETFNLDPKSPKLDGMVGHVRGLNRYSFSKSLRGLISSLDLDIEYKDVKKFINIRNELVHQAEFLKRPYQVEFLKLCENENTETKIEQYHRIISFVSRILLGILEYSGYYWSWFMFEPGGWMGEKAKQRIRMTYLHKNMQ